MDADDDTALQPRQDFGEKCSEIRNNLNKLEGELMYKIPSQEYTAEFGELAVKRVKSGQGIGAVAKGLGPIKQTLRNLDQRGHGLETQWARSEDRDARDNSVIAPASLECRASDGVRYLEKNNGVLRHGWAVKCVWMDKQRTQLPLPATCSTLGVSASGYCV